ncbi:hypothetical protein [Nonomuraea fuscirosea]
MSEGPVPSSGGRSRPAPDASRSKDLDSAVEQTWIDAYLRLEVALDLT